MGIFLDTGNLDEIKKFHRMGIIRGVTTNPTIMSRENLAEGMDGYKKRCVEIASFIAPLPLSVEVTSNDFESMRRQGLEFATWASNINIKIPIHGPQGEIENLELIHEMETKHNIRVNVTAMMNSQQAFLAAMAGASYVSIFGGRVQDMGYDASPEIASLRNLIDQFQLKAKIIVGSCREILNIIKWFEAGAHIVTAPAKLIQGMIVHPFSKETVQQFVRDGARFEKK